MEKNSEAGRDVTVEPAATEEAASLDALTDAMVSAATHPIRAAILRRLGESEPASVKRIAEELGVPRTTVAEEIRRLHEAGVIEQKEVRRRRGTVERFFGGVPAARWVDDDAWTQMNLEQRKRVIVEYCRGLMSRFSVALKAGSATATINTLFWSTVYSVDDRGWDEILAIHDRAIEDAEKAAAEAVGRLEQSSQAPRRVCTAVACLEMPSRPEE